MSDALTDIARAERKAQNFSKFLHLLTNYLKSEEKDEKLLNQIIEAAYWGAPRTPYWGTPSSLSQRLPQMIKRLIKGSKKEWAKLLWEVCRDEDFLFHYEQLKSLSPFRDRTVVIVDYGLGFINPLKGDPIYSAPLDKIIRGKGWRTYDADTYLVAFDEADPEKGAEVFWLACGWFHVKGPRKASSIKPSQR